MVKGPGEKLNMMNNDYIKATKLIIGPLCICTTITILGISLGIWGYLTSPEHYAYSLINGLIYSWSELNVLSAIFFTTSLFAPIPCLIRSRRGRKIMTHAANCQYRQASKRYWMGVLAEGLSILIFATGLLTMLLLAGTGV